MDSLHFPDVNGLTFEPVEAHADFCKEYSVGINLLHSHHGVSEMFFFDDFKRSRPATSEDKVTTKPCSFFVDKASNSLIPFEWTADNVRPMPSSAVFPELTRSLLELQTISGVLLGFTLREVQAVTELEFADQPGWHCFIPTEKYIRDLQSSKSDIKESNRRSIITNFDVRPGTEGPVVAGCQMYTVTNCISNEANGYSHETFYQQRHG
jgi:hypothetical protein